MTSRVLLGPYRTLDEARAAFRASITERRYFSLGIGLKGRWRGGEWYGPWHDSVTGLELLRALPLPLQCSACILANRRRSGEVTRLSEIVHSDPEILGGTPVFVGTRVPVQSLFDYLEGGDTLDEFLRQFPSVRRDQAIAALDVARTTLLAGARSS